MSIPKNSVENERKQFKIKFNLDLLGGSKSSWCVMMDSGVLDRNHDHMTVWLLLVPGLQGFQ